MAEAAAGQRANQAPERAVCPDCTGQRLLLRMHIRRLEEIGVDMAVFGTA